MRRTEHGGRVPRARDGFRFSGDRSHRSGGRAVSPEAAICRQRIDSGFPVTAPGFRGTSARSGDCSGTARDHSRVSGDWFQVAAGRFTNSGDEFRFAGDHSGIAEARFHWQATAPGFPETDCGGRGVVPDFRRPVPRGRRSPATFPLRDRPADDQFVNADDRCVRAGSGYAMVGGRSRAEAS